MAVGVAKADRLVRARVLDPDALKPTRRIVERHARLELIPGVVGTRRVGLHELERVRLVDTCEPSALTVVGSNRQPELDRPALNRGVEVSGSETDVMDAPQQFWIQYPRLGGWSS